MGKSAGDGCAYRKSPTPRPQERLKNLRIVSLEFEPVIVGMMTSNQLTLQALDQNGVPFDALTLTK